MSEFFQDSSRRILIVSSHPLFGQGLRSLLRERRDQDVHVIGIVPSVDQAVAAIEAGAPDLVIVDYDDEKVNRDEFLARFVESDRRLRVVLLSLKEGGSQALIYDRRSMAASQIDDWLTEWSYSKSPPDLGPEGIPAQKRNATEGMEASDGAAPRRKIWFPRRGSKNTERVSDPRSTNMKHLLFAIGLVVVLTVLLTVGFSQARLLPEAASVQAGPIDRLFGLHFVLISFLFSLIVGFMVYTILVFRRKPGDETDAPHIEGNTRLEVIWTIVPLAVVLYISYLGAVVLADVERPQPRPLEVKVVASQWSWRFEYPASGVTTNELVLPVNQPVLFRMTSTDVIHSFWVPEFRVKQDILPGGDDMMRELRITPNLEGEYTLRCAEMCGQLHAQMEAPVRVVQASEFEEWLEVTKSTLPEDPAGRGQVWAEQYGCLACHSTDGTPRVGPTWQGVYEHEVPLQGGGTVFADEAYLLESIVNPGAKVVAGFENIMPNLSEGMTDEQIAEIIEFIKTLK